jgi:hypothetical protein
MPIFKSTNFIFDFPWAEDEETVVFGSISLPPKTDWSSNETPKIEDITLWEQIYLEPGNVGIYAAWNPYVEFYIITYNLFLNKNWGYETFFGKDAVDQVLKKCQELGIELTEYRTWING